MPLLATLPHERDRNALALFEIVRFEALKRTVGYAAAANLLITLADRVSLLPHCRSARGDRHYVEVSLCCPPEADLRAVLEEMASAISGPIDIDGYEFNLGVRMGAAERHEGEDQVALFGRAERALARANERRTSIIIAAPEDESAFASRLVLMRGLQEAIREDQLELHYQPKVMARSGETAALEALVRWNHPTEGMIPPDRFIGLAEETGDINKLTEWVIRRAISDQGRLLEMGHKLPIDVNISGVMIADPDFAWDTLMLFTAVKGEIGFEITETAMIADPARALENLRTIADAGIKLAIDDYGSGFSSLAYLQQLPVSELKIDKIFISRLASGQRDPLLVRSTIELAHALEMKVTAEGVDSPEALALLQVMGCDMLQGFYLSRPLPFDRLVSYLETESARTQEQLANPHRGLRARLARAN
ncbi:GGDEF domain-containing protein [Sphingomonas sp. AP4-R1]|uniref:bifunctional diguanylate cyclase/phosphodiesterase n=1 Tax=Sphingomonas sp. AP4-R1 TaxID=2735134 RepID=UPI0014939D7A|nr:EAL domain-containing protein [Sphingomonas sp. AP4-R1]QJU59709.1 GGDEF domain-containing protein [Sphingomonas sp. AP4-R1]